MTPKNTGFRPESLRLIAAALALHQAERIATSITPLPGTDRFIAIGTPAEVARLLEIAPGAQEVTQQAAKAEAGSVPAIRWDYCPECGSYETHEPHEGSEGHYFCAACNQEWYSHIDYTDVVRGHLSQRAPTTSTVSAPVQKLFDAFEKGAAPFKVEVALDQLEIEEVQIGIDPIYLRDIFADAGLIEVRCTAAQAAADKSED